MAGDNTLFARDDEVVGSWKLFSPILEHWATSPPPQLPNYAAGTWGPEAADQLLLQDNLHWRLI